MPDALPQTVTGSLKTAFDPRIGIGIERVLPHIVSIVVLVWSYLQTMQILPDEPWVPIVSNVIVFVSGFYVRHSAAPPPKGT